MKPRPWNGRWIGYEYDPRSDIGAYAFRRDFTVDDLSKPLDIRITADQRYKLYLNGKFITAGPQRGDLQHWFYEELNLAHHAKLGQNRLEVVIWSMGRWAPMAQHYTRLGLAIDCLANPRLATSNDWDTAKILNWDFAMMAKGDMNFYIDVGPGEIMEFADERTPAEQMVGRWKVGSWKKAHDICQAEDRGVLSGSTPWMLVPRSLPLFKHEILPLNPIVRHGYVGDAHPTDADGDFRSQFRGKKVRTLLLDMGELVCGYPQFTLTGTEHTRVTISYSEGMWQSSGKGNRNEVTGKEMKGYSDIVILSDQADTFEPLWWRTFRYILLETDSEQGFALENFQVVNSLYPYRVESSFKADHPSVKPIFDVSVRTAKLCAGENYFDCPYYEQLQYAGDTRIQALIGYYLGRDRALQRQAIESFRWSRMPNGLTQSRYPSRQTQVIPPFSLWWILMLHDQLMYDRVKPDLSGVKEVLEWWNNADENEPFWCFADWVWNWGVPPEGIKDGLHYETRRLATLAFSDLCKAANLEPPQLLPRQANPPKTAHERALRVLADRWEGIAEPLPEIPPNVPECTFYFKYYEHQALRPNDYLQVLKPWEDMINLGLTTFAEMPEPGRSDCHAWSAHPILGFYSLVAGVTSAAPGWRKARIEPNPGSLKWFEADIAHPDGTLSVHFRDDKLRISTPVEADVFWKGVKTTLRAGESREF